MAEENFKMMPDEVNIQNANPRRPNHRCLLIACVIGVLFAIVSSACVTYSVVRYVPYFNKNCFSTPGHTDSLVLQGKPDSVNDDLNLATEVSWISKKSASTLAAEILENGKSMPTDSPSDQIKGSYIPTLNCNNESLKSFPGSKYTNLDQNYNLNDSCRLDIEKSAKKWMVESQQELRQYLNDDNSTLQCAQVTPVPHKVLQKILDSYKKIENMCKYQEQINDEFQMQSQFELKSAKDFRIRIQECSEKQYCPQSGNSFLIIYLDRCYQLKLAKIISGKHQSLEFLISAVPWRRESEANAVDLTSVIINDSIYWIGYGFYRNEVWRWSISSGKWSELAPLPKGRHPQSKGRYDHCTVAIGDKIYVLGGSEYPQFSSTDDVLQYDVNSNKWIQISNLRLRASGATCIVYKHLIYIFERWAKFQIYNTQTNRVYSSSREMLDLKIYNVKSTTWNSHFLYFGDTNYAIYNLESNTWGPTQEYANNTLLTKDQLLTQGALKVKDDLLYVIYRDNEGVITDRCSALFYKIITLPVRDLVDLKENITMTSLSIALPDEMEICLVQAIRIIDCNNV